MKKIRKGRYFYILWKRSTYNFCNFYGSFLSFPKCRTVIRRRMPWKRDRIGQKFNSVTMNQANVERVIEFPQPSKRPKIIEIRSPPNVFHNLTKPNNFSLNQRKINKDEIRQGVTWSNFTWSNHLIEIF
jgi:hypothetical protein